MNPITLFSFGYWGWGSAVPQLVRCIDEVEKSRSFGPPLFVDIRISRSVRAAGFDGNAFEAVVGATRYRWLDDLGNLGVKDKGAMRLKDPAAVNTLLDIAIQASNQNSRVIFYCACPRPCDCHRSLVARLTIEATRARSLPVEIVEWPGENPDLLDVEIEIPESEFKKILRGAKSIPLDNDHPLSEIGAIPWYALVAVAPEGYDPSPWRLLTGPANYKSSGWYLPIYGVLDDAPEAMQSEAAKLRADHGFNKLSAADTGLKSSA